MALVDLGHTVEVFGGQPYPVLDERVPLTKLPSLDIFNDHYPGRFPASGRSRPADLLEFAQFSTGTFPEPLAFSARATASAASRAPASSTSSTTTSASATGSCSIEQMIPTIVTLHHPITKDRELEMEPRAELAQALVGRPLVLVRQDAGPRRLARCRASSSSARTRSTTSTPTWASASTACGSCPSASTPTCSRRSPDVARVPGRLITTASADVALKGLAYLLEAMAKLRTERDVTLTIIGKPQAGQDAWTSSTSSACARTSSSCRA